jgi:glycosyltransferase involved in cell wall biosynthesis
VLFTGQVEPTRVTLYLNAADVLVIPDTVTDLTASPLKMFEYMAVAKPIVCVDLPALREILNDESAIFFPRRDVAALTRAIGRIAESPELAARLAQQAVTKACAYTYTARAARIVEALGSITKYR